MSVPNPYSAAEGSGGLAVAPRSPVPEDAGARRKVQVLVVDEPGILRDGLCALLESDTTLEVLAASPAVRRESATAELQPQIVVTDFSSDPQSGPQAIAQ